MPIITLTKRGTNLGASTHSLSFTTGSLFTKVHRSSLKHTIHLKALLHHPIKRRKSSSRSLLSSNLPKKHHKNSFTMNIQCGQNLEACLIYFVYSNKKWNKRTLSLSKIPFYATPPIIKKKPIFCTMTEYENTNNSSYNWVVEHLTGLCADTGPMNGWLVFFFYYKISLFFYLYSK